jgi:hypothetical protein
MPTTLPARPRLTFFCNVLLAGAVLALSGCASVMRVDSAVQSHAKWPSGALPTSKESYEFERLPSQSAGPTATSQATLETLVRDALAPYGWELSTTSTPAPWRVTISAQTVTLPRAPWDEPREGWPLRPRLAVGLGTGHGGLYWGGMLSMDMPYYQRSVSLVVRDGQTGRVAYETQAAHDGRWHDSPAVWRAMIDAALQGFPAPPTANRTINIDIPR